MIRRSQLQWETTNQHGESRRLEFDWKPIVTVFFLHLFTIAMAALLSDVRRELSTRQLQPLDGIFFSQVLYADDTLIFGANLHNASTHIDMQLKNIQNTLGST